MEPKKGLETTVQLDRGQLAEIKDFISRRGFKQADLQYEILDHMACKVEEKMGVDPSLGFNKAVTAAHRDFGIFGFSTIEDAMRRSLEKQYGRQVVVEAKLWFRFPTVILLMGWAVLLYWVSQLLPMQWVMGIAACGYLVSLVWFFIHYIKVTKRYKYTLSMQSTAVFVALGPGVFFQVANMFVSMQSNGVISGLVFVLMVFLALFYVMAARRVMNYAIARCQEFEKLYGAVIG